MFEVGLVEKYVIGNFSILSDKIRKYRALKKQEIVTSREGEWTQSRLLRKTNI